MIVVSRRRLSPSKLGYGSLVASACLGFRKNDAPRSVRKAAPPEAYTAAATSTSLLMSTSTHSCPNQQNLIQIYSLCCVVVLAVTRCDGRNLRTSQQSTIFPKHGGRSQTDPEVRTILLHDLHLLSSRLCLQHYDLGSVG